MSFANPVILFALLLLPLLVGLKLWGDSRSRRAAARLAGPRLLPGLLVKRGHGRSWLVLGLELGALAAFITALARPQYGFLEEENPGGGRSLIIAIDTSRSMLTDDLKPSRLERTQLAAIDLIRRLRGDRIGLMPFAGNAFMYAPITADLDALLESVESLDTEIIPRGGSNLARPIDLALETFEKVGATGQQVLILFSDGENLEGTTLEAAQRAKAKNMSIITIGVGTQAGALIPDPRGAGGLYRDREGKPVLSRLQPEVLKSISHTTGGLYLPLDENGVNDRRIDLILEKLERASMKGKLTQKPIDRYRWPLGIGLLLLTGSWLAGIVGRLKTPGKLPVTSSPGSRAGLGTTPAALALAMQFLSDAGSLRADTPASPPANLPSGNPWELYQKGEYAAALQNFNHRASPGDTPREPRVVDPVLEFGRGGAAYKTGEFDAAVDAFGSAVLAKDLNLRAQAHYNLGNSIYQRSAKLVKQAKPRTLGKLSFLDGLIRQLENSLENYQQALLLEPNNPDFRANHDTTDKLIEELRKKREQMAQQQGQGKGKQKKKGQKGQGESQGKGEGESGDESGGKGPDGEEEGEGEGDEEREDGSGGEGEEEREAREKSNQEKEGKIGEQGSPSEKSPADPSDEPDEASEADSEVNPETGYSAADAKQKLEQFSDEAKGVRRRIDRAPERRPLRDW